MYSVRDADPSPLLVPWSRKSRTIPLLPLWALQPVQSLSACTRVHFTFFNECMLTPKKYKYSRKVTDTIFVCNAIWGQLICTVKRRVEPRWKQNRHAVLFTKDQILTMPTCFFTHCYIKSYVWLEVWIHAFLISALGEDEWLVSLPAHIKPEVRSRLILEREDICVLQPARTFREINNSSALMRI